MPVVTKVLPPNALRALNLIATDRSGLVCHQIALKLSISIASTQVALDTLHADGMVSCTSASYGLKGKRIFYHPTAQGLRYLQTQIAKKLAAQIDLDVQRPRISNNLPAPRGKLTSHLEGFITGELIQR